MLKKNLEVLALLVAFNGGFAYADAYEAPAAFVPVSSTESEPAGEPMSCKEARETVWFINELSRSDGGPNETVYVPCRPELLASTADAD